MNMERKRRMLALLEEALELETNEQQAFLERECEGDDELLEGVVAMLSEDEDSSDTLARPAFDVHAEEAPPRGHIDSYRLVERLGRGGMGTVYLAEREDFEHRVALKVIHQGLHLDPVLLLRFHNERQILARMQHPHIARLLDGGYTDDHLPYFAMEYVEGEPIDSYCRQDGADGKALGLERRLRLFIRVCRAVQYAHGNLVVHRDLKPSNILITAHGEPKLLDFGVAKLLDDNLASSPLNTGTGQAPLTPRYSSPEQLSGDLVTTASDVYSLGVLLYELLAGCSPYRVKDKLGDEIAHAVRVQEPERPSTAAVRVAIKERRHRVRRQLRGDLDAIVLKALRKDPDERYSSAEQLADDIERFLNGEPVRARPGTWGYLASRFLRRNWSRVAIGVAFLILSLIFVAMWSEERSRKSAAEQYAKESDRRADDTQDFVKQLFDFAGPDAAGGRALTSVDLLRRAAGLVQAGGRDPLLSIDLAGTLARLLRGLGLYDDALELMGSALQLTQGVDDENRSELAKRMQNLAALYVDFGMFDQGVDLYLQALNLRQQDGQRGSRLFRTRSSLASAHMLRGELDVAAKAHEDILASRVNLYEQKYGEHDKDIASSRHSLASVYLAMRRLADAERLASQALDSRRRIEEDEREPTKIASSYDLLGRIYLEQGRIVEARNHLQEALEQRADVLGNQHRWTAMTKRHLAESILGEDPAEAERLLIDALEVLRRHNPAGWEVADTESVLGQLRLQQGRLQEAAELLARSHPRLAELRGEETLITKKALARNESYEDETGQELPPLVYQGEDARLNL